MRLLLRRRHPRPGEPARGVTDGMRSTFAGRYQRTFSLPPVHSVSRGSPNHATPYTSEPPSAGPDLNLQVAPV